MIPREEVEFTLAMAQKGVRCEAPAKVMEELCRVYLAWVDAPEVEVNMAMALPSEPSICIVEAYVDIARMGDIKEGARLKLVEAPDVGG